MSTSVTNEQLHQPQVNKNLTAVTILLAFCGLIVVSNVYTMIPLIGKLSSTFNVPTATAAWAGSSIFSLFYAIGFLIFGPISDRFGRKQVLVPGMIALAASTLLVSFAQSIQSLLYFRAMQGFVAASFGPVALAYVFDIYPPVKRPTTVALISTGFLLAGIVGQIVSSSIAGSLGWPYVFISFAVVYVLAFLLIMAILPTVPGKHTGLSLFAVWKQMFGLLRDQSLIKGYTITFTLLLSFVGMYSSLGGYLTNTYGLKAEQLLSIRAAGIIGMLLTPFAGKFTARFGYKRVLLTGLIGATIGLWLEWAMQTVALITIASVVFVAGISIVVPTLINIIGIFGKQARGGAVALYTFFLFLGASAGPIIASFAGFKAISLILVGVLGFSTLLSLSLRIPEEGR